MDEVSHLREGSLWMDYHDRVFKTMLDFCSPLRVVSVKSSKKFHLVIPG